MIYLQKYQLKKKVWPLHRQLGHLLHCCLVSKLWLTLWNLLDWSTPGFPDLHYCLGCAQTHVHCVGDAILLSHYLSPPSPIFSLWQHQSLSTSQIFSACGHSIGASVSALVLPMNIQDWFPLGMTDLISLLSKELSRVFTCTTLWKHQFFSTQLLYGPTLTSVHGYWENQSFDLDFVSKVTSLLFSSLCFSRLFFQGANSF